MKRGEKASRVECERPDQINLVAVQMEIDEGLYVSESSFRKGIEDMMGRVARRTDLGPDTLVVLPEDIGLFLVLAGKGPFRGVGNTAAFLRGFLRRDRAALMHLAWTRLKYGIGWTRALLIREQESMADIYFGTFAELARRYAIYLAPGSGAFTEQTLARFVPRKVAEFSESTPPRINREVHTSVYNTSPLFDPEGRVIGVQRKVHLTEMEEGAGLELSPAPPAGTGVVNTPLGRIGVAICFDAFHDDFLAALKSQRAEIMVQPGANPLPWEPWQQEEWLEGSHRAVREGFIRYAVNPMLTGRFFELKFAGQSSILGLPGAEGGSGRGSGMGYLDTGERAGFLAVSPDSEGEAILSCRVPHPERYR